MGHEESQSTTTIGQALRRTAMRNWSHAKARFNRYLGSRKNLAAALAGNVMSTNQTVKYIEALRQRVNMRYRDPPEYLTRDDFERLLDAPREVVDRIYDRISDYAVLSDADDARDEAEEEQAKMDAVVEGHEQENDQAAAAQELLHPLRAARVSMETVAETLARIAARADQLEKQSSWITRDSATRYAAGGSIEPGQGSEAV